MKKTPVVPNVPNPPRWLSDSARLLRAHPRVQFGLWAITLLVVAAGGLSLANDQPFGSELGAWAWAVGIPLFLAESVLIGWDLIGAELNDIVVERLDEVSEDFHGLLRMVDPAGMELLNPIPSSHLRSILIQKMFGPVIEESAKRQGDQPLVCGLDMTINVTKIEDLDSGKLMVLNLREKWQHVLPAEETTGGTLFKPLLVCRSDVLQLRSVMELAREGVLELLWPAPYDWLLGGDNESLTEQVREVEWLTVKRLVINHSKESNWQSRVRSIPLRAKDPAQRERDLTRELTALFGAGLLTKIPASEFRELADACFLIVNVDCPPEPLKCIDFDGGYAVEIESERQYKVWVKGNGATDILYRYEIPFWRPTFIKTITFSLSELGSASPWALDPASVNSTFLLTDEAAIGGPERQTVSFIRHEGIYGTPCLPGHGVTFSWHDKVS